MGAGGRAAGLAVLHAFPGLMNWGARASGKASVST
jgi:hypothetical protein